MRWRERLPGVAYGRLAPSRTRVNLIDMMQKLCCMSLTSHKECEDQITVSSTERTANVASSFVVDKGEAGTNVPEAGVS